MDGCANFVLGDTVFIHSLIVSVFDDTTHGDYDVSVTNVAGSASVGSVRVTEESKESNLHWDTQLFDQLLSTVRADALEIVSEPQNPIEGSDEFCLSAGTEAKIICRSYGFPVPVVEFFKDGSPVVIDDR